MSRLEHRISNGARTWRQAVTLTGAGVKQDQGTDALVCVSPPLGKSSHNHQWPGWPRHRAVKEHNKTIAEW